MSWDMTEDMEDEALLEEASFLVEANTVSWDNRESLKELLNQAKSYAQALVSEFYVGAVAVGNSGQAYLGTNLEFLYQSLSQTVHAEQFALTLARLYGETGIQFIAVTEIPCGHCRQFLMELGQPDLPILILQDDSWLELKLNDLLPHPFTLATSGQSLMSPQQAPLELNPPREDNELVSTALLAAQRAYVPYTKSWSGVAIRTTDGQIFQGSALESAAYNPTLPALQSAFIHMTASHAAFHQIQDVVFVEAADARTSGAVGAWNLIKALSPLSQTEFVTALSPEL